MRKLNARQKKFCSEYLVDLNATQAAIRAGYKKSTAAETGYENLRKPHIAAYLEILMDKREKRTEIKVDDVLTDLRELADVCMGRKPITNTEDFGFNPAGANKALELLGKHSKLFDPPVRIQFSGDLSEKGAQVLDALGSGKLSPSEASTVMGVLHAQSRLVESDELIARIERLEEAAKR